MRPDERREWRGWLPVDVVLAGIDSSVDWLQLGAERLSDPVFHHTVTRLRRERPGLGRRRTELGTLIDAAATVDAPAPGGFIFHMSRCGSTLVANALRAIADTAVVVEPPALSSLLTPHSKAWPPVGAGEFAAWRDELARSAVRMLGHDRGRPERRFLIKLASWNVLRIDVVRALWPDVPWLFVTRDPVEVMASNLARPPGWMNFKAFPGDAGAAHGLASAATASMGPEEFCARALGAFCGVAAAALDARAAVIDYRQLDLEGIDKVLAFFGIDAAADGREGIRATLDRYAKDPSGARSFVDDSKPKQAQAGPTVRAAADRWALASYRELISHPRKLA